MHYVVHSHIPFNVLYCCLKFDKCFLCEQHFNLLVYCNLFQNTVATSILYFQIFKVCMQYLKYSIICFFATNSTVQKPTRSYKYICEIIACMHDVFRDYKKGFTKVRESWLQYLKIQWKWIKGLDLNCFWIVYCSNYLVLHWNMAFQQNVCL